jgi:uncharacterized protein (DUF2235 family)
MKRIVICADGTWNRPEENLDKDFPTNVLKIARSVSPVADDGVQQVVFYDWGIGSYYDRVKGGAFGEGINKNIMDAYRFIVQNYKPGDELHFLGFSRGAYTVRSLAGFIYNCGILKRRHANRIQQAFDMYKHRGEHPEGNNSVKFRKKYAVEAETHVRFIGVWDTVGSLGVPFSIFGFLNEKHLFHDHKIGPNIDCARHALAIDELRDDFKPTIWNQRRGMDLKQVWFAGVHCDVGGGYKPGEKRETLSDIPLKWIIGEAGKVGVTFEKHLVSRLKGNPLAEQHQEYEKLFKILGKYERRIGRSHFIHRSVKERHDGRPKNMKGKYRPKTLTRFLGKYGWANLTD